MSSTVGHREWSKVSYYVDHRDLFYAKCKNSCTCTDCSNVDPIESFNFSVPAAPCFATLE